MVRFDAVVMSLYRNHFETKVMHSIQTTPSIMDWIILRKSCQESAYPLKRQSGKHPYLLWFRFGDRKTTLRKKRWTRIIQYGFVAFANTNQSLFVAYAHPGRTRSVCCVPRVMCVFLAFHSGIAGRRLIQFSPLNRDVVWVPGCQCPFPAQGHTELRDQREAKRDEIFTRKALNRFFTAVLSELKGRPKLSISYLGWQ